MLTQDWQMNAQQREDLMARWQAVRANVYDRFFSDYPQYAPQKEEILAVADSTYTGIIDALAERAPQRRAFEALSGDGPQRSHQQRYIEERAQMAEKEINRAIRTGRRALRSALGKPTEFEPGYDALADPALALIKPIIAQSTMNFRQVCGTHVVIDVKYWGSDPEKLSR